LAAFINPCFDETVRRIALQKRGSSEYDSDSQFTLGPYGACKNTAGLQLKCSNGKRAFQKKKIGGKIAKSEKPFFSSIGTFQLKNRQI